MIGKRISDLHYRALLDLFMCSDPYPCSGRGDVEALLDMEASARGYKGWVNAYHMVPRPEDFITCPRCKEPRGEDMPDGCRDPDCEKWAILDRYIK